MNNTHRLLFDASGPKARRYNRIRASLGALLLGAAVGWVAVRMHERGQLAPAKWEPFLTAVPWTEYLLPGILDTLRAAAVAIVFSIFLGLLLAMARMSEIAVARWASGIFVEFFRAVPVLIMMLFTFFFLSYQEWVDDTASPFIALITGLTLYNSSVLCEVIRSGVDSLPAGQREGGLSIGLSSSQVRRLVLIPQALTAMLPTLVSQIIVITKDSALGYIITYSELLTTTRQMGSRFGNTLPAYIVTALIFILINYSISKIAERVEARQRLQGNLPVFKLRQKAGASAATGEASGESHVDALQP